MIQEHRPPPVRSVAVKLLQTDIPYQNAGLLITRVTDKGPIALTLCFGPFNALIHFSAAEANPHTFDFSLGHATRIKILHVEVSIHIIRITPCGLLGTRALGTRIGEQHRQDEKYALDFPEYRQIDHTEDSINDTDRRAFAWLRCLKGQHLNAHHEFSPPVNPHDRVGLMLQLLKFAHSPDIRADGAPSQRRACQETHNESHQLAPPLRIISNDNVRPATLLAYTTPQLHAALRFLRVAVDQADDFSVSISQTNYIDKMLDKFVPSHKLNAIKHAMPCNPATFAKLTGAKSDEERARMRELPYMQLIGSLLYLSCMSRPDIAFHMSILCSFMSNPSQECYDAAIALLLYCGATKHKALRYTGCTDQFPGLDRDALKPAIVDNQGFQAYSDASWHKPDELGFNSFGWVIYLFGGPISFASKKLKVVALSSAEAEYAAASYTCKEIEFVRNLLRDLGYPLQKRCILAVDNSAAKQICENMGVTGRTKHFQDNLHYVRQLYDYGKIYIEHVRTHLQRADGFTKPLEKLLFLPWRSVLVE